MGVAPGHLSHRLTKLARVTGELAHAESIAQVSEVVVVHCADAVEADVSCLFLRDGDDHLQMVGLRGGLEGEAELWDRFPLDDRTPLGVSVLTGERLVLRGAAEIARRFPALQRTYERTLVALPLRTGGRSIGVIGLTFLGSDPMDSAELEFLEILADSCAQALRRIEAQQFAHRSGARLTFLAAAATELAGSLDHEATLAKVAQLVVPEFADWCAVDLVRDERLHRLSVAHVDREKVRLAQHLHERYPSNPDSPQGAWQAMRTGESMLVEEVTDEMLVAAAVDEEHLRLARELQLRSAIIVPLIARGRVLGVITFVAAESGRRYGPEDLAFAEDLAGRGAVAIDNAELHSQTLAAAVRLQRAVLPDALPAVAGWELAKRYDPSGRTDVGGDFYDVIPLADGRLILFVGDVMGRGVEAAAAMAQMRAAVRAYSAVDPSPAAVLRNLDLMFERDAGDQLVTLVYLLVEPAQDRLLVASAGHPAPLLLAGDGSVSALPEADGCPLGVMPDDRVEHAVPLRPGDTLVAFTDGLIEGRDQDIDVGRQRVVDLLSIVFRDDLQTGLDKLVDAVRDPFRDDDVAVLVARRRGSPVSC